MSGVFGTLFGMPALWCNYQAYFFFDMVLKCISLKDLNDQRERFSEYFKQISTRKDLSLGSYFFAFSFRQTIVSKDYIFRN